jgi:hypothetical protein
MSIIKRLALGLAAAAVVGLVASGCSGYVSPRFGGGGDLEGPGYEQYQEDSYYEPEVEPPTDDEIYQMTQNTLEELGIDGWSCTYSPTYDEDWHNDVLCRNGGDVHRPYLREWDSFVTEAEIMESAREYEAQINAGG